MHIPDDLTGDARRAHLALHGQTLHDSWMKFCSAREESDVVWGTDMTAADEWEVRGRALAARRIATSDWFAAVRLEFGEGMSITVAEGGYLLGNGEFYRYVYDYPFG